jgi:hypothetical protein
VTSQINHLSVNARDLRESVDFDVELDYHGAGRLPDDLRAQANGLWDFNAQSDETMRA